MAVGASVIETRPIVEPVGSTGIRTRPLREC
jgi:hypothetical protein